MLFLCEKIKKVFKKLLIFVATYVIMITVKGKPITISGQAEKGAKMDENMTTQEFNLIIDLIIDKLEKKEYEELLEILKKAKKS